MIVLVLEYITGGGKVSDSLPAPLLREGELMLNALINELSQLPQIEIVCFRDHRLPLPNTESYQSRINWIAIENHEDFWKCWIEFLGSCDAVWPIAPETGGILEKICNDVEDAGRILLNSSSDTVNLTASKYATVQLLRKHGIPAVPTIELREFEADGSMPWVVKPDNGVGCDGLEIISSTRELTLFRSLPGAETKIIQPYLEGEPLSLSVLFNKGSGLLLAVNRQYLIRENRTLKLVACEVNGFRLNQTDWQPLAARIAGALPGLWGYAGVDLINTSAGPFILEINPRLTTSYAGLGDALGINVAQLILDMLNDAQSSVAVDVNRARPVFVSMG